jgi:hypothetical protein
MKREDYPTPLDWYVANEEEYRALISAEDGNLWPLAAYVERVGFLATEEARAFVAARLRGDKRKRGQKRTIQQQTKEIIILGLVRHIQAEQACSEYQASQVFIELHGDLCNDENSLKTILAKAKDTFKTALGKAPPPVVLKKANSTPE